MAESNGTVLASRLKAARHNTGLTQRQVARLLGIEALQVSRWERGEQEPGVRRLKQAADLYGVPVDWLLSKETEL